MIQIPAIDNYSLSAKVYLGNKTLQKNKVLIINSATAVQKNLYHHYATYMSKHGYNVVTYDYRGIADSRPKKLKGFKTSFTDWGEKDFSGVIDFVKQEFPNDCIVTLGHSIGGTIIGMTPKNTEIRGIITIAAQTAYYKDWSKEQKKKIYFLWHVIFPLVTKVIGYFPGKKLGLLEDVPKGVVDQWHTRRKHTNMKQQMEAMGVQFFYNTYSSKLLTLGIEDDPIGTRIAIKRVHDLFVKSDKKLEIIPVSSVPTNKIGHFGFFSRKFQDTLWKKTLLWFDTIK
ncbi:alpha/beta hydrolase family protein [Aquimarina aggregata]|uniref:alpha/beta hydrolase family protein n=1 Tax=Aquimarina aggregata TaxID=1642818 RepID=UPI00248FAD32|nr:alpha/beta fold hydrolase [Aquimarina aggregata]